MRFLLDQDVYAATVRFLSDLGHDVSTASQIGASQASDADLLRIAGEQDRIFVTRDRDFGALVFLEALGAGVLYLRMLRANQQAVHAELRRVLELYPELQLKTAFVVVEAGRHRFRRLPSPH